MFNRYFAVLLLIPLALAITALLMPLASNASGEKILWSADMETGDMSQWYAPARQAGNNNGGGVFNSGIADAVASTDYAHSGKWSAKLTITAPPPGARSSGARLFRWKESHDPAYFSSGLYYSAWLYFPHQYRLTGDPRTGRFWNLVQFKSKHGSGSDPVLFLDVQNRPNGGMYSILGWWNNLQMEGPRPGQFGGRRFEQRNADLPVGRWVHIETYLKQADDFSGHITVWQDGEQIFDEDNIRTKYPNSDDGWSVNLYSDGLDPNPSVIYVDDAKIATYRVGP